MTMADRVAVMRKGVLQQVAPPAEVYDRPANLFVAGFIGSPPMNLFAAHIAAGDTGHVIEFGSSRLALVDRPGLAELVGREVVLGIRPEDLEDTAFDPGAPPDRRLVATVDLVEQLGSDVLARTVIDAVPATGEQVIDAAEGTQVGVAAGAPLVARCNPRSRPVRGGTIELSVDTERIHLFDPATGLAIR
jgi:multiple sugar transport system ATP-binding protein